ncbi:Signal transduction histidine kinase [Amycolatopsis tolypomycina]|uniref:histidine kinase n=1 Tax=Amycolatopsis tolypomycina TaxID=208445 RepID=A0A1H5B891_9PSEU|nr:nitrate- and nitrite sensing domain-containing protein [Amycolatopsis tolypomycina]SED50438.1 Signal transduction histidine kinase [Amycolatopsis tolypomycina]
MLTIALIPSMALLMVGVALAGYLIYTAVTARDYTTRLRNAEAPAIPFFAALQAERQASLALLAGQGSQRAVLAKVRPNTDATAAKVLDFLKNDFADRSDTPASVQKNIVTFFGLFQQLPQTRQAVDSGQMQIGQAFGYYNQMLDQFTDGVAGLTQNTNGAQNAFDRLNSIPLFTAADAMQRSDALAAAGLVAGGLSNDDFRAYTAQVGAYHVQLAQSASKLVPAVKAKFDQLMGSQAWQTVNQVESAFARGDLTKLPVPQDQWRTAAGQVGGALMNIFVAQHSNFSQQAIDDADTTFTQSLIAGVIAVLFAVFVVFVAVRLSNRLIGRLHRLREDTLDAAEVRLPELVARVQAGEPVDLEEGGHFLDHGTDEIGQVADAFNKAQQTAIAAAIDEAKTKEGTKTVFLNIAHRSQVIVHRQLKVLDQAERKQEDPDQLDTLFQLDHLSTRARRNAENLIILGGGQPGRQWRNPVGLAELVRGASAETEDFARVKTAVLPQIAIRGPVVGDLVHLLAELIDNATSFSPPQSRVEIRGNVVGKGVVIEVEDQGLGLEPDQTEEINAMLADPPDFGIMALSDEPRLGLFVVARLAARHGIQVHLRESAYGGTRAIVLVRTDLLAPLAESEPEQPITPPKPELVPNPVEPETTANDEVAPLKRPVRRPPRHRTEPAAPSAPPVAPPTAPAVVTPPPAPVPPAAVPPVTVPPPTPDRTPAQPPSAPTPVPVGAVSEPVSQPTQAQPVAAVRPPASPNRTSRPARPAAQQPVWPPQEPRAAATPESRPQQPRRPEAPGRPPLPQRRRQQNLVPQLREDKPAQEREEVRLDSPEAARSRLSAFQQGTRRARDEEFSENDDRYGERE